VTGAGRCDSEEVSVGGLDNVDAAVFDGFDYVALGHIHSPQWIGRETLRYSGTPLKYSFSEAEQEKSVAIVEMKEKGRVEVSKVPLKGLRDMRKIRGTYLEVMSKSSYQEENREDFYEEEGSGEEIGEESQKLPDEGSSQSEKQDTDGKEKESGKNAGREEGGTNQPV